MEFYLVYLCIFTRISEIMSNIEFFSNACDNAISQYQISHRYIYIYIYIIIIYIII